MLNGIKLKCINLKFGCNKEILYERFIKHIENECEYIQNKCNYCNFTGIICKNFSNSSLIETINLGYTGLVGQLPSEGWTEAVRLSIFNLSFNYLSGPLPSQILGLRNGMVILNNNNLNGALPPILPQFFDTSLRMLFLQVNKFTGCIPWNWNRMMTICLSGKNCPGLNVSDNYFNCSDLSCMSTLPQNAPSVCPNPFYVCDPGKFCWNVPPTIVLMITFMCGGFMVGNLAMFFATKVIDMGIHEDRKKKEPVKSQLLANRKVDTNNSLINNNVGANTSTNGNNNGNYNSDDNTAVSLDSTVDS